jgi:hypothetical protein
VFVVNRNTLADLANKAAQSLGAEKIAAIAAIRAYFAATPFEVAKREIEGLKTLAQVNNVVAAGAPGELYNVLIRRMLDIRAGKA